MSGSIAGASRSRDLDGNTVVLAMEEDIHGTHDVHKVEDLQALEEVEDDASSMDMQGKEASHKSQGDTMRTSASADPGPHGDSDIGLGSTRMTPGSELQDCELPLVGTASCEPESTYGSSADPQAQTTRDELGQGTQETPAGPATQKVGDEEPRGGRQMPGSLAPSERDVDDLVNGGPGDDTQEKVAERETEGGALLGNRSQGSSSLGSRPQSSGDTPPSGQRKKSISLSGCPKYNSVSYRHIRKGNTKQRIDEFESMMHA